MWLSEIKWCKTSNFTDKTYTSREIKKILIYFKKNCKIWTRNGWDMELERSWCSSWGWRKLHTTYRFLFSHRVVGAKIEIHNKLLAWLVDNAFLGFTIMHQHQLQQTPTTPAHHQPKRIIQQVSSLFQEASAPTNPAGSSPNNSSRLHRWSVFIRKLIHFQNRGSKQIYFHLQIESAMQSSA